MAEDVPDQTNEFNEHYRIVNHPAMRRVERRVIGCEYGATSYTTRGQAADLARRLELEPGKLLLDVGSGAGWPGIYLARSTGCRVVLTDVPLEGLRVASRRLEEDRVSGSVVVASGDVLPLRDGVFDAATSSDVFC
ncbi:MAG: class I SAM-dependent methyltransferase [Actinomycetota bacterium]|nr:class I SAM-dependent methyltransferase [Actinomycetota bacterium]